MKFDLFFDNPIENQFLRTNPNCASFHWKKRRKLFQSLFKIF